MQPTKRIAGEAKVNLNWIKENSNWIVIPTMLVIHHIMVQALTDYGKKYNLDLSIAHRVPKPVSNLTHQYIHFLSVLHDLMRKHGFCFPQTNCYVSNRAYEVALEELFERGLVQQLFLKQIPEALGKKVDSKIATASRILLVAYLAAFTHPHLWTTQPGISKVFIHEILLCLTLEMTGSLRTTFLIHLISNLALFTKPRE